MAISLVGTASATTLNGADPSVTLPGGTATGDVVYGAYAETNASDLNFSMVTSGYTELADVATVGGASPFVGLGVYRKVQGGTPDTTAVFNGSGNASAGVCAAVMVLRGVDATPEDATTTTASGGSSGVPNPPAITTVTDNAWVLAIGASREADVPTAPSGYSDLIEEQGLDTDNSNIMISRKLVSPAGAENPGTYGGIAGTVSDNYCAATVAVRPAADTAVPFGWFEQFAKGAPASVPPPKDLFVRPIRDGREFTTPTPADLGWFEPFAKAPPIQRPLGGSVVLPPQPYAIVTLTTEIGWFETWPLPLKAARKTPDNSFVRASIDFSVAPPLGWFEAYPLRPPTTKGPASSVSNVSQPFIAVTLTTDLGWFQPWPLPLKAVRKTPDDSFVRAAIDFAVAPPIGWFEAYGKRPPDAKGPASSVSAPPQPYANPAVTPSQLGWYEPYAKRPLPGIAPASSIVMDPQAIAAVTTLTTDIGWFVSYGRPPAPTKARLNSWSSFFGARPDLGVAWFEPYPRLPRRGLAPASAQTSVIPPAAVVTGLGWYFQFSLPLAKPKMALSQGWLFTTTPPPPPEPEPEPVPGGESRNEARGAKARMAAYNRAKAREEAQWRAQKRREELELLAARLEQEGITLEDMFGVDYEQLLLDQDEEAIALLLLHM